MDHIGQAITWGTATAPHLCTGVCTNYRYDDGTTRAPEDDEAGEYQAVVLHSSKASISFDAKVSADTDNFLDLSTGPVITVDGITTGVVCARSTTERWALMARKTISVDAMHYPDIEGTGPEAGDDVDAAFPEPSLAIVYPGNVLVYSTVGLGHASGVVHELEITQELQLSEDDPSPDGRIVGVQPHGYMRTFRLRILAKAAPPAKRTELALTGSSLPARLGKYRIENVVTAFEDKRGKMYEVNGLWIPPFGAPTTN